MPALKSDRLWADIPRVPMFDDVDLNENEDMSNPNERPRSMLMSCFGPCFRGGPRLTQIFAMRPHITKNVPPKRAHENFILLGLRTPQCNFGTRKRSETTICLIQKTGARVDNDLRRTGA